MQDCSKLIGSSCRQLAMYWSDFTEISMALLSTSCRWKFKGSVELNILPKLINYMVLRSLEKSDPFLVCFEAVAVLSALRFQCISRNSTSLSGVVNIYAVI